jgi:hypothetical protein
MYEKVRQYYLSRLHQTKQAIEKVQRDIYYLGTVRLLIVIAAIVLIYFLHIYGTFVTVCILFLGIVLFLFVLQRWNRFQKKKQYMETSAICDQNELDAMDYRFDAFDGAPERIRAEHPFGLDLDIFGNYSLFQSINRTVTIYGKQTLCGWFEQPELSTERIESRQQAVGDLSCKPEFMHHFKTTGRMNQGNDSDHKEIEAFISEPALIGNIKWWKILRIVFPVLWVIVILLAITGVISILFVCNIYLFTLAISLSYTKKINRLQSRIGKRISILNSYSQLIQTIEDETFESKTLLELQSAYRKEGKPVSAIIGRLAQLAEELEQRSNIMVLLLLNPTVLWDIRKTMQIDRWRESYGGRLNDWMQSLGEYDAFISLATFAYTHPDYVFPELTTDYFTFVGKNLGHPLIKREQCVRNDINMQKTPYVRIVTGANMAGKSTYLRTVGVNMVLACMGAPVCADVMRLSPATLVTSLRTSDSLNDNESYFFAELKRLKMIIDRLEDGEKLFILLDEILKGTNSVDKQKGSLALIQQFIRLQSCGIIATHDLLLGSLELEFPEQIKNHRFEADIIDTELFFSYRLMEGIAQNMNAHFLMKKMGITL